MRCGLWGWVGKRRGCASEACVLGSVPCIRSRVIDFGGRVHSIALRSAHDEYPAIRKTRRRVFVPDFIHLGGR
jgi:hypothetical protein